MVKTNPHIDKRTTVSSKVGEDWLTMDALKRTSRKLCAIVLSIALSVMPSGGGLVAWAADDAGSFAAGSPAQDSLAPMSDGVYLVEDLNDVNLSESEYASYSKVVIRSGVSAQLYGIFMGDIEINGTLKVSTGDLVVNGEITNNGEVLIAQNRKIKASSFVNNEGGCLSFNSFSALKGNVFNRGDIWGIASPSIDGILTNEGSGRVELDCSDTEATSPVVSKGIVYQGGTIILTGARAGEVVVTDASGSIVNSVTNGYDDEYQVVQYDSNTYEAFCSEFTKSFSEAWALLGSAYATVTLVDDVRLTTGLSTQKFAQLAGYAQVTNQIDLNLNGHTLTIDGGSIAVVDDTELNIIDTSSGKSGDIVGLTADTLTISNGSAKKSKVVVNSSITGEGLANSRDALGFKQAGSGSDWTLEVVATVNKGGSDIGYYTLESALAAVTKDAPLSWVRDSVWPSEKLVYARADNGVGEFYTRMDDGEIVGDHHTVSGYVADASQITVYCRPKSPITTNDAHWLLNKSTTIYGNNSNMQTGGEADLGDYFDATGHRTICIYNLGYAGVWGTIDEGTSVDIEFENCSNVHSVYVQEDGDNSSVNMTVKNCTFKQGNRAENSVVGIVQNCRGSIAVENCSFDGYGCAVDAKNSAGNLSVSIRNCTFTGCGLASNIVNSFSKYKDAAIRVAATNGATSSLVIEGATFSYRDSAEKNERVLKADVVVGDNRTDEDGKGVVQYDISNTAGDLKVAMVHAQNTAPDIRSTDMSSSEVYRGMNVDGVVDVRLSDSSLTVIKGESADLTATVLSTNPSDQSVTWSSTNPGIASYDETNHKVIAHEVGTTIITATSTTDEKKSGSCTVEVVPVPVSGVEVSPTTLELYVGGSSSLTARVLPEDAGDQELVWANSDDTVASFDSSTRTIQALKPGTTTITATSHKDDSKTATCTVTVKPVLVSGIALSASSMNLIAGQSEDLTATVSPDNATDPSIDWSSTNEDVATYDATEQKVVAHKAGEATITATAHDGSGESATCAVNVTPAVASVTITPDSLDLIEGESKTLTAAVLPDGVANSSVTWGSDHTDIASVSDTGLVTACAKGTAVITAKSVQDDAKTAVCTVTVTPAVSSVTLDETSVSMILGKSAPVTLTATVSPEGVANKAVTWETSAPGIASVSSEGVVTAEGVGTATITAASVQDASKTATCTVTVTPPVSNVSLDKTELPMILGKSAPVALTATVSPEGVANKAVTWESSAPGIASVDSEGVVEAKGVGVATITAKSVQDTGKTATCTVTVTPPVSDVSLDKTELPMILGKSDPVKLVATVTPSNAASRTVTWESSDTSVATVDGSGTVEAKGVGTATITAKSSEDSAITATCTVTVTPAVGSVSLDKPVLAMILGKTSSVTLTATVSPEGVANKAVTWESSAPGIASVDSEGVVEAKGVGTATITAKSVQDTGKTATCTVTVTPPVSDVSLDKTELPMVLGKTEPVTLEATVSPSNAADTSVEWESSDGSVATVDTSGVVTACGVGTATITAKSSEDSAVTATCTVTVTPAVGSVSLGKSTLQLVKGASETLSAQVVAAVAGDVADPTVSWSSSDEGVATVDGNGKITAVNVGNAVITATSNQDGAKYATCAVEVVPVPVSSVSLSPASIELLVGQSSAQVVATVEPSNAGDTSLTWAVEQSGEIISFDSTTGIATALAPGTATITATSQSDNSKKASCTVTVSAVPVSGVALNHHNIGLKVGKTFDGVLQATVSPSNAGDKTLAWSVQPAGVISFDSETGIIEARAEGTATITVTSAADDAKSDSCAVTVSAIPVQGIALSSSELSLEEGGQGVFTAQMVEGEQKALTATVLPADATYPAIDWTSSDESVAVYDPASNKVVAKAPGTAAITATSRVYGAVKASCQVTVVTAETEEPAETHVWNIEAVGAVASVTCANPGCSYGSGPHTVTLAASGGHYTGAAYPAAVAISDGFPPSAEVPVSGIAYYRDGAALSGAPVGAGTYTARVTVGEGAAAKSIERSFTIAPKPVTAYVTAQNRAYIKNMKSVNLVPRSLEGVAPGDSVSIDVRKAVGVMDDDTVGTGKPVIVYGVALTGADAANYVLTLPVASTTVDIAEPEAAPAQDSAPSKAQPTAPAAPAVPVVKYESLELTPSMVSLSSSSAVYDGKVHKPQVTVVRNGTALDPAYYRVDYGSGNYKKVKTYRVSVYGVAGVSGVVTKSFRITKPAAPVLTYQVRNGKTWKKAAKIGKVAGTPRKNLDVTGMRIMLGKTPYKGTVKYRCHVKDYGWEKSWRRAGTLAGFTANGKRVEALQIKLTGELAKKYDIWYTVYSQDRGWMGWTKNGKKAGTQACDKRLEAYRVKLLPKGTKAPGYTAGAFWKDKD